MSKLLLGCMPSCNCSCFKIRAAVRLDKTTGPSRVAVTVNTTPTRCYAVHTQEHFRYASSNGPADDFGMRCHAAFRRALPCSIHHFSAAVCDFVCHGHCAMNSEPNFCADERSCRYGPSSIQGSRPGGDKRDSFQGKKSSVQDPVHSSVRLFPSAEEVGGQCSGHSLPIILPADKEHSSLKKKQKEYCILCVVFAIFSSTSSNN